MYLMIPFMKAKKASPGTISKDGKKRKVGNEWKWIKTHQSARMNISKVKSLANQDDVAHSAGMIRAMYRRRSQGEGFQCKIASQSDLTVILKSTTFALISAGRNPKDPVDKKMTDAQVDVRTNKLKKELMQSGYVITDTLGNYEGLEDSMMVMTHDANKKELMAFGARNKQDSIIFVENGKQDMIFTAGPNAGKSDMSGKGFEYVPNADNYYTEIKVGSKKVKFSLNFGNIEKAIRLILGLLVG